MSSKKKKKGSSIWMRLNVATFKLRFLFEIELAYPPCMINNNRGQATVVYNSKNNYDYKHLCVTLLNYEINVLRE